MKFITILLSIIIINLIHENPFDRFIKRIPDGWSSKIDKNKLFISKDSLVKIQYFNYGMESEPPIINLKYEIVIEYTKRLKDKEIINRIRQKDSLMMVYKKKYDSEPTRINRAKYENIETKLNTNKMYVIPFYSDDKYSYFIQDNFPYGYIYLNDSDKTEIDLLISKIKNEE